MPDRLPEEMSDRMRDRMPKRMPKRMPETMPDRMSDRRSEYVSGRMSVGEGHWKKVILNMARYIDGGHQQAHMGIFQNSGIPKAVCKVHILIV